MMLEMCVRALLSALVQMVLLVAVPLVRIKDRWQVQHATRPSDAPARKTTEQSNYHEG
jgi:hypothetical protein